MTNVTSHRILTCSYNRRRTRVQPHLIETDYSMQSSKSTPNTLKSTRNDKPLHKPTLSSSENVVEWPLASDVKHDDLKDLRQSDSEELYGDEQPSIFRSISDFDDHEDMMMLKRASPIYDSDDEDYIVAPSKRQRTSGETVLQWSSQLTESQTDGFSFTFLQPHA